MTIDEITGASKASQNKVELKQLLKYVSNTSHKVVVEIGVHKGYSLLDWYRAFKPEILVGIDIDMSQIDHEALDEIRDDINCRLVLLPMDSTKEETRIELAKILDEKQIDFLFIDGDHRYEAVKSDFGLYKPLVRTGGVVSFDDVMITDPKFIDLVEVNRFWNELTSKQGTKSLLFWDDNPDGFGKGNGVWIKPEKELL